MSRYLSLEQFRKRFEVVPTDDLSAREPTSREPTSREPREEPTSREPTKYFDPFAEREDV
jgi:hypothetical protein